MEDFDYVIGTHPFSVRIQQSEGKLRLGITVERLRSVWTEVFGDKLVIVDRDVLLSALISFWPKIAGPYAGFSAAKCMVDLSALAGYLPDGKVYFVRDGYEVSFPFMTHVVELGSESVIPVEVLLALGNVLAADAPPHLQAIWRRASIQTDLPPFPLSRIEDMGRPQDDADNEVGWYAAALGQDVETYVRTASWLHARQLAFAVGHPDQTEPTQAEYDVHNVPALLPTNEEIDAIYSLSAKKLRSTVNELRTQAIDQRNMIARNITVFRKFFPAGSKADVNPFNDLPKGV
jgi:hypothetical protein